MTRYPDEAYDAAHDEQPHYAECWRCGEMAVSGGRCEACGFDPRWESLERLAEDEMDRAERLYEQRRDRAWDEYEGRKERAA